MQFKNLEKYKTGGTKSQMQLAVPIPKTPVGRVYRYSPNEKALPRLFVLGNPLPDFVVTDEARKRMKLAPHSKQTVCPYSGTIADNDDFIHPDDIKAAHEVVKHAALADVSEAFHDILKNMESKFSSSKFIKMKAGPRPAAKPKPRFTRRDLLRELICDHCGRDYGVFAIALFCPDCGAPNLRLHFARETVIVAQQVELAEAQEGKEELAYRLMGNAHEDVLTAFEATQKAVYLYGIQQLGPQATEPKPVRNDFQNVENAQRRFSELGIDPFSCLTEDELVALKLNIQKRHIIGHNLGVMDEKFADHTENVRIGETVHLVGEDIRQFSALAQRVVNALDTWLAGGIPGPMALLMPTPSQSKLDPSAAAHLRETNMQSELGLSDLAMRIAKWIVHNSTGARGRFVNREALVAAFSDHQAGEIAEAVDELSTDGYVRAERAGGRIIPHIQSTVELFATFDPLENIGDPTADSVELVAKILEQGDSFDSKTLHDQTGWPLRRFNPAVSIVIAQIDQRRVSAELSSEYPARHFRLYPEDRVALKRYAARFT
jgi:hypothetical protein